MSKRIIGAEELGEVRQVKMLELFHEGPAPAPGGGRLRGANREPPPDFKDGFRRGMEEGFRRGSAAAADQIQREHGARLNAIVPAERIFRPSLDDTYELTGAEPVLVETTAPRRLAAAQVASVDWNNDLASLVLDLNEEIRKAADEKTRQKIIRRLRRAEIEKNNH